MDDFVAPRVHHRYSSAVRRALVLCAACLATLVWAGPLFAQSAPTPVLIDRVALRWFAPDVDRGGAPAAQFVFERELAFEARLQAFEEGLGNQYAERHVRTALDRHVAEVLLLSASRAISFDPAALNARRVLLDRALGQRGLVQSAAALEGLGDDEVERVLARRAQASLAVERVTGALASGVESDLCDPPCDAAALERADRAIAERLAKALEAFYAAARARVTVVVNSR